MVFAAVDDAVSPAPAAQVAPAPPSRKIGFGIEGQVLLPLGDLAGRTNPLIGPLLRLGYRVAPSIELTVRTGYLAGLTKASESTPGIKTSESILPLWAGARVFFMEPEQGLYGVTELALNLASSATERGGLTTSTGATRFGFNAGAGYVISKDLPIDFRAQLSIVNVETPDAAVGLGAGYTFQF